MSTAEGSTPDGSFGIPAVDSDEHAAIRSVLERYEDGTECTLYPEGVDGIELMSRWITASEGSFVSLAEMR